MDEVGSIIRFGGAREAVAPERIENARARVGAHWERVVADERRRMALSLPPVAFLAAGVLLAICATWFYRPATDGPVLSAGPVTVSRVVGGVSVDGEAAITGLLLPAGAEITTEPGGLVALALPSGHSLRIDSSSRVIAATGTRFELTDGAVYVDSGRAAAGEPVAIGTPFGTARDVGTQFEVRLLSAAVRIGVREGVVDLVRPDGTQDRVESGQLFELEAGGDAAVRSIPAFDAMWSWAGAAAPVFDIDGATLAEYLYWLAREKGLSLRWEGSGSEDRAARVRLDGTIAGMTLDESLQTVSRIAVFEYRLADGVLTVRVD